MSTNPFDITNPQFFSLRRAPSRSPSRSPTRTIERFPHNALDPLLSDLSPSRTLEALSASPTFTDSGGSSSALRASIVAASPAQRAFAVRAAVAHKKLRDWTRELSAWEWPDGGGSDKGFLVPTWEERAAKRRRLDGWGEDGNRDPVESTNMSGTGGESRLLSPVQLSGDNDIAAETEMDEEYWGSIPAPRVLEYERRIDDIKRELEALDVEELKSQVLDAHVPSRSRPSSSYSQDREPPSFMHYVPLGDFTALITATTLQALPYLSRVTRLMNTWSVRITVLRTVPTFLRDLDMAEEALRIAFDAIEPSTITPPRLNTEPGPSSLRQSDLRIVELSSPPQDTEDEASSPASVSNVDFTRQAFTVIRDVLKEKVASLGQLLDNMLDDLEGRDDTIPEQWIEKMESVEENYGSWVVEAEKKVLEYEWRLNVEAQAKEAARIAALQPQKEIETEIRRGVGDDTGSDENILCTTDGGRDIGEAESSDRNAEVDGANDQIPATTLAAPSVVSTAIAATTLLGSLGSNGPEMELPASFDDLATSLHHDVLPDSSHDHGPAEESIQQIPQPDALDDVVSTLSQTRSEPLEQRPSGLRDSGVIVDPEERDVEDSVDPKIDGDNVSIQSSEQGSATDSNTSMFNNLRDSGYEPVIPEEPETPPPEVPEHSVALETVEHDAELALASRSISQTALPPGDIIYDLPMSEEAFDADLNKSPFADQPVHTEAGRISQPKADMEDLSLAIVEDFQANVSPIEQLGEEQNLLEYHAAFMPVESTADASEANIPSLDSPWSTPVKSDFWSGDNEQSRATAPALDSPSMEDGGTAELEGRVFDFAVEDRPKQTSESVEVLPTSVAARNITSQVASPPEDIIIAEQDSPLQLYNQQLSHVLFTKNTTVSKTSFQKHGVKDASNIEKVGEVQTEERLDPPVLGDCAFGDEPPAATCLDALGNASSDLLSVRDPESKLDRLEGEEITEAKTISSSTKRIESARVESPPKSPASTVTESNLSGSDYCVTNNTNMEHGLESPISVDASVDAAADEVAEDASYEQPGLGISGLQDSPVLEPYERATSCGIPSYHSAFPEVGLDHDVTGADAKHNLTFPEEGLEHEVREADAKHNLIFPEEGLKHGVTEADSKHNLTFPEEGLEHGVTEADSKHNLTFPEEGSEYEVREADAKHILAFPEGGLEHEVREADAKHNLTFPEEGLEHGVTEADAKTNFTFPEERLEHGVTEADAKRILAFPEEGLYHDAPETQPEHLLKLSEEYHTGQESVVYSRSSISSSTISDGEEHYNSKTADRYEISNTVVMAPNRERSISSISSDSMEEQSPSVRQFRKRQDTVSSDSDPMVPLPVLQIPKRRSNSPVKALRKYGELHGNGNDDFLNKHPIDMSDAIATENKTKQTVDDHLEERINSILTTIPARIRLTSEAEVANNIEGRLINPKNVEKIALGKRSTRVTSTGSPSYTLAPAYGRNPRQRTKGSNPDIKMYHLHRSGGEAPIKLFVRLVGEKGERVMVRVGGGWSDLGEFLKDYASHHGRRSTSDGRVEVRDVPLRQRGSVASLAARAARGGTPRPDSAMSRPGSSLNGRAPATPQGESARRQEITPPSGGSSIASTSRLSLEGELGLAGPKSRRADMSAEKQAWVEGMLGEVRRASAATIEKKEDVKFGELGRVEGVKRVFRK